MLLQLYLQVGISQVLINAMTKKQAIKSLEYKYNDVDWKSIIKACIDYHKPIDKYFGSGVGLELQNLDAKIALDILEHFAYRNIPVLPVHDSFIIDKEYSIHLLHQMKKTYKKHTGFNIKCK